MPDHMSAWIMIGGELPADQVYQFGYAVQSADLREGWGGEPYKFESWEELEAALNDEGHLVGYDEEAPWGEFTQLEGWLVEHQIGFDRHSNGKYEYDAELRVYRPGWADHIYTTNQAGEITLTESQIDVILKLLRQDPPLVEAVIDLLDRELGHDIPPLSRLSRSPAPAESSRSPVESQD